MMALTARDQVAHPATRLRGESGDRERLEGVATPRGTGRSPNGPVVHPPDFRGPRLPPSVSPAVLWLPRWPDALVPIFGLARRKVLLAGVPILGICAKLCPPTRPKYVMGVGKLVETSMLESHGRPVGRACILKIPGERARSARRLRPWRMPHRRCARVG